LVMFILTFIGGIRWREITRLCGTTMLMIQAFRFSMIAAFFNQTLLSTVGGDAARIWLLVRQGARWSAATYSVLIDRVVGIMALALLVFGCLPWTYELVRDPVGRGALVLIGFGSTAAGILFFALGWTHLPLLQRWLITRHLNAAAVITSLTAYRIAGCRTVDTHPSAQRAGRLVRC
jgi:uncharacterized membrane protein YbhN (UPF0104 family)